MCQPKLGAPHKQLPPPSHTYHMVMYAIRAIAIQVYKSTVAGRRNTSFLAWVGHNTRNQKQPNARGPRAQPHHDAGPAARLPLLASSRNAIQAITSKKTKSRRCRVGFRNIGHLRSTLGSKAKSVRPIKADGSPNFFGSKAPAPSFIFQRLESARFGTEPAQRRDPSAGQSGCDKEIHGLISRQNRSGFNINWGD